jgi:hypothetical protein
MKKFLFMLCLLMGYATLHAATATVDGITWSYRVSNGEAEIYNDYDTAIPTSTNGAITIPSTLGGYPVTSIGDYAFYECGRLSSVTIPEGVTSIGDYAFEDCWKLKKLDIPSTVKSIGRYSGEGEVFAYSFDLKITVAAENPNYTSKDGALFNKDMTTLLRGPGATANYIIPDGVTDIAVFAFCGSERLEWVTIPASVTSLSWSSFDSCTYVRIKVKNGNKHYIASSEGALFDKAMTTLIRGPGKTAHYKIPHGIEVIGARAFKWTDIKTVELPNSVTIIEEGAFFSCTKLASISLPNSVNRIERGAFDCCESLTSLTIPASVTMLGSTFVSGDCVKLKSIYFEGVPPSDEYGDYNWASDWWEVRPWKLTGYYPPTCALDWEEIIDKDGYIYDLKMKLLSKSVTVTFNTNGGNNHLGQTGKIQEKTTFGSVLVAPIVTRQHYTFTGWSPASTGIAPAVNTTYVAQWEPIINMGGDVEPRQITYTIKNKQATITGCSENISGWLDIPEMIGDAVVTSIAANAFKEQIGVTDVTFPDTITSVGADAFKGCVNLLTDNLVMPLGLKTLGKDAFTGCQAEAIELRPGAVFMKDGLAGYKLNTTASGAKLNAKTGILTATFTKPGEYEVVLSKPGYGIKAVSFNVRALPILSLLMDGGDAKCKVTGAGAYLVGKKSTLKATASKGYVFAGWYKDGVPCDSTLVDYRNPSYTYVMGEEDTQFYARFVTKEEEADYEMGIELIDEYYNSLGDDVQVCAGEEMGPVKVWVDSLTLPTAKVTGLPTGLKFDAKTFTISGKPTKPGFYPITIEVKNASKSRSAFAIVNLEVRHFNAHGLHGDWEDAEPIVIDAFTTERFDLEDCFGGFFEDLPIKSLKLPAGLTYNAKTGTINGNGKLKCGSYTVTLTDKAGQVTTFTLVAELSEADMFTYEDYLTPNEAWDCHGVVQGANTDFVWISILKAKEESENWWDWDCYHLDMATAQALSVKVTGLPSGLRASFEKYCSEEKTYECDIYLEGKTSAAPGDYPVTVIISNSRTGQVEHVSSVIRIFPAPSIQMKKKITLEADYYYDENGKPLEAHAEVTYTINGISGTAAYKVTMERSNGKQFITSGSLPLNDIFVTATASQTDNLEYAYYFYTATSMAEADIGLTFNEGVPEVSWAWLGYTEDYSFSWYP